VERSLRILSFEASKDSILGASAGAAAVTTSIAECANSPNTPPGPLTNSCRGPLSKRNSR